MTPTQQTSLLKVLVGVFAWMFLMALAQQTAIWGAEIGWALVGVLGAVTLACLAALLDNATGRHQGTLWLGPLALTFAIFMGVAVTAAIATGNQYYIGAAVFWCLGCLIMAPYLLRAFVASRRSAA